MTRISKCSHKDCDKIKCIDCKCDFTPIYDFKTGIAKSRRCETCRRLHEQSKKKPLQPKGKTNANTKPKRVNTKKKLNKKLDDAWSKLVKLKAGNKCEYCGKTKSLNSHHIYSRAKMSVRWSVNNGICLCVGHHIGVNFSAHKTGVEFAGWLMEYKGMEYMTTLKFQAQLTSHYHVFEREFILKELLNEIKEVE